MVINKNRDILETPAVPDSLPDIDLDNNSKIVLSKRYLRKDDNGQPMERIRDLFWRVAWHVALEDQTWGGDVPSTAEDFYNLLVSKKFFPNSPTFTGAGTPLGQLAACFVLPISDDMGKMESGIFQTLRDAALIQQTGGGNGFSFSRLRPAGSRVKTSAGTATGPVGFMKVYDNAFNEVAQGGTRRGANMAVMRVDHPDIERFITCKTDENAITNFNISVGITDEFMQAVLNDESWDLRFPDVKHPAYRGFDGTIEQAEEQNIPIVVYKTINARELFNKIIFQAHHNGEPGLLFLDTANKDNPVPHLYRLESTNPCGEQWLGPYENCCLGSVNLASHLGENNQVDWVELEKSVRLSTHFLDNVIDANQYVPSVPKLQESAKRARRIGLGIMGLADLMYHTGIRYGSEEGQAFAEKVIEFVRFHSMKTSVELAEQRGAFPVITGSIYDPDNLQWQVPQANFELNPEWNRPEINWDEIVEGICKYGIRNSAQTTIAPTGTIATVAGCEGYGCEPVFALAYVRHVNDNGQDIELTYSSPKFTKALEEAGLDQETRDEIIQEVMQNGTAQHIEAIPENIRNTFVVSHDISAEEHVRMQAAMQTFVDNSLSKTINFPAGATEEDVATAFMLAWELGCKGITVYVTGSREKVVLETQATKEKKEVKQAELWVLDKKPRPQSLPGYTYSISTPLGKAFITINENGESKPFEVFINTAKAGSDTAAVSEAIGRLISYVLRISSPIEPTTRMQEIITQLSGIGGRRHLGFGPNRVLSLPDGVAQMLTNYLDQKLDRESVEPVVIEPSNGNGKQLSLEIGDLCPECGQATLVNEEGCRKCYACGYSEC